MNRRYFLLICLLSVVIGSLFTSCSSVDRRHVMVVSAKEQRMVVFYHGDPVSYYPVSTSKRGLGDTPRSYRTPVGTMKVAAKIGGGAPVGAVFKSRVRTGEVLPIDAPGRDPIVTRILWLEGTERSNANAYQRYIYIHGTPEERNIGRPVSYGCIRMRSHDVIELYDRVGIGARLIVTPLSVQEYKSLHSL